MPSITTNQSGRSSDQEPVSTIRKLRCLKKQGNKVLVCTKLLTRLRNISAHGRFPESLLARNPGRGRLSRKRATNVNPDLEEGLEDGTFKADSAPPVPCRSGPRGLSRDPAPVFRLGYRSLDTDRYPSLPLHDGSYSLLIMHVFMASAGLSLLLSRKASAGRAGFCRLSRLVSQTDSIYYVLLSVMCRLQNALLLATGPGYSQLIHISSQRRPPSGGCGSLTMRSIIKLSILSRTI